ncbi:MAG: Rpn family recombination-promoting nuclease/putative transposase [Anaerolineae bacterium]|nr:Rpn family recombination-promoting nuclease/putative transposase [Anaerolineae bacterium]
MPPRANQGPQHLHDSFFKDIFSDVNNARQLILRHAPPALLTKIDLSTLQLYNASFVDDDLGQHFADLVFLVKRKNIKGETYICLLFEHKSYPDRWVSLQLVRYVVRVWEYMHKNKAKRLTLVFPMVVYHGKRTWTVKRNLHALVDLRGLEELARYVPNFDYHLLDMSALEDDALDDAEVVNVALGAMKHIFDDNMRDAFARLVKQLRQLSAAERQRWIKIILSYVGKAASKLDKQDVEQVFSTHEDAETKENLMTLAQQWINEGKQVGLLEGKQVGLLEGEIRGKQVGLLEGEIRGKQVGLLEGEIRGKQVGLLEGEIRGKQVGLLEGEVRGKQVGLRVGRMEVAMRLFRRKFKLVPDDVTRLLNSLTTDQLADFGEAILDFTSIDDGRAWLAAALTPKQ